MNSHTRFVARSLRLAVALALIWGVVPINAVAAQSAALDREAASTRSVRVDPAAVDHVEASRSTRADEPTLDQLLLAAPQDSAPQAPTAVNIIATKRDALVTDVDSDTRADPGDTLEYTVLITNSGTTDATGVQFDDNPDANTTFVGGSIAASPVAVNDAFPVTVVGNVSINSASLITPFSVTANDFLGVNPSSTISAYDAVTANGGQIVMTTSGVGMGQFTYNPPPGFEGTDTFTYTLADNSNAPSSAAYRSAIVSITVSGMVWFIDNTAASCTTLAGGCGRLSNPFSTLAAFNAVNTGAGNNPADNDSIFIYESATAYTGGVTLRSGQKLIGQDATTSLSAITGLTPPTGSPAFPAMNTGGSVTTVQNAGGNAVTLNQSNTIRGLTISGTSGAGIIGTGINNLTVGSDVSLTGITGADLDLSGAAGGAVSFGASVTNTGGRAISIQNRSGGIVDISGAINDNGGTGIFLSSNTGATINLTGGINLSTGANTAFSATGGGVVSVTGGANVLNTTTATALNVVNTTIGASGLTFRSISANGAAKGIVLNATGSSGGLSVTGTGSTDGSGGTIQNISTRGAEFIGTSNLSLKNMNFTNANNSVDAGSAGVCDDLTTTGCNAAIYLNNVSTVTLDNLNITGTMVEEGINGNTVSNFTLSNSTIANCGNEVEEGCIKMRGLTGTSAISNSNLSFPGADVVEIVNASGSLLFNVDNSTFRDSQVSGSGNTGIQLRNQGTASGIINVNNSTFLRIRTVGLNVQAINSGSADIDVTGSTFDPDTGTMIGIDLDADNTATLKFNIQNNTKIYSRNGPAVNIFGDTNAVIDGRINNNTDVKVLSNAPLSNVGSGIRVNLNKDASGRLEIKNNAINVASDDAGIDLSGIGKTTANPGGATNTLDATVTGNNVTIGATSTYGIFALSASSAGNTNAICVNVASNAITRNPSSIGSFRARVPSATGYFRMQGFVTNAEATWNANGNTPSSSGGSEVSFGGSGTFGSCTAALPTNPTLSSTTMPSSGDLHFAPNSIASKPLLSTEMTASDLNLTQASTTATDSGNLFKHTSLVNTIDTAIAAPEAGGIVNVNAGALPAGKGITIKFRAMINSLIPAGVLQVSNQGTVTADGSINVLTDDPDTGTANDPTVTPLDIQIDLQVTKTVNPATAYPGLPITYTITYQNAGPQASADVVITDPLPSALTGVAYQSSVTVTPTGSYVWTIGALLAGQGGTITVTGLISSALAVPATITNTATITGTGRDTNTSNNTASVGLPITDLPISGLNAINDSPTLLGSATHFTATVTAGTNVVYQWNFGDGSTGSGATAARTYVAIGTYTATVTATNSTNFQVATTVVIVVDVPIAGLNATNDSPTRLGNATSFTATINAGSNVAYAWDFGDGTTGSGATPAHTYTALGTYTATVTATNSTNQQVATTVVTVIDQPISGLTAVNDSPTQMGNTTHFTATISGGTTVTYQWDFGDGFTGSSAITPHIYDAVGSYVATVTATNGVSVVVTTTNVSIVDVPITGLTAANSSPTVLGNSTAFTATISGGSNVTYQWNFGDGSTGNGANTSYPYAAIGTYTATVTATNGSNTQVATTVVTIFDTPIAGLTATSDSPTRLGNATNFTATTTGGSGIAYAWDFGDGVTGSGATPPHTYAALGTYTATVTATNSLNSQTASTVVVVIDQPIQGLSAINDSPTRLGSATNFTATNSNGTNLTYQWNFGDGFTGSGANDSHTYGAVGSYVATVTATNSVSVVVATTNVSIIDTPIVNLAAANDSPTQLSSVTNFTATIGGGSNVTYQWSFGDGSLGSGAIDSHTYGAVGASVATVTATNGVSVVVATTNVSIIDRGIVGLNATNSSPTGLGNATIFTATIGDGSNVTYAWNFGDGNTDSGANTSHTYGAIGTYTATVTATNGVSVVTASTVATIVNQPISGLSAANSSPTRLGSATNFTATVATGSTVTYAWDFGDGATGSGVNASHPYAAIGTYTATVTATNVINMQTASTVVVVIDRAIVGLSANNNGPTRLGSTTAFTATIGDGSNVTYQWNFGDGSTVSGANSSHTYGAVGAYVATVTATNGVSVVVATTNVSIIDTPIVNLTAANSSPTGLSLSTFVTATIGSGSNVAYAWNFGDGSLGSDANASHVYPALGAYTATVTATNGVSNVVATTLVTIVDQPLTTLSATSSSPTLLGNTSLFTATANGTSVIYTWNFGDDATGGGANASHTYTATGLYTAIVTATNSVGSLTATLKVNVFSGKTYLPLIARNYVGAPDLVVTSLRAGTGNVQVVIKNQGDRPATDGFYVDVYINPHPAPTAVNQIWSDGRSAQGLTWGVTSPMQPGQVLTLTIGDAYYLPDYSVFTGPLPIGTPVYAQVDSFDPVTTYGTVRENHEIVGAPYNNILGPVPSTAAFAPLSAERPFVAGKYWLPVRLKAQ